LKLNSLGKFCDAQKLGKIQDDRNILISTNRAIDKYTQNKAANNSEKILKKLGVIEGINLK